ncbi:Homocysteine/cysteine synthase [Hypoxylon texense]
MICHINIVKFPGQPFGLSTTEGTSIVIPPSYLDQLRGQKALSFGAFLDEEVSDSGYIITRRSPSNNQQFAFKSYTKLGNLDEDQINILVKKLNPTLPQYVPVIQQLIQQHWPLQKFQDYQAVKLYPHVHLLSSRISARTFQGSAAANDDKWLDIATTYIHLAIEWTNGLREWSTPLRPLVYTWLPGWADLRKKWDEGRDIIREALRKRKAKGSHSMDDPPSFMDFLVDSDEHPGAADDVEKQLVVQMQLCVAAIQALSSSTMQCLIDLATHNDILPELRAEIHQVTEKHGGVLTKQGLSEMLKLDSFVKETQRLNSQDLTTMQRKATADLKLPNGMFIPKGTKVILPSIAINLDEEIFEDAQRFDAFRFYRSRTSSEDKKTSHQLVSVGKKDLAWGYGKHACPGRFMADVVVKLLLIEFIVNYDIRNVDGHVGRPKNIEIEGLCIPDPECKIMLRARR